MWQLATKLKESKVKVAKLDADEHHEIAEEVSLSHTHTHTRTSSSLLFFFFRTLEPRVE